MSGARLGDLAPLGSETTANAPPASGPVFVAGLDRSGKTTMAAFLASHPRIAIPPVGSNMETYFLDRYGDLGVTENLDRCLAGMLRYSHIAALEPDPDRIRARFREGAPTYERLFGLFLQGYAERVGKPRWGAQTGLLEAYAPRLFEAYPGVKIVHMVRDPRDRYEASRSLWPDGKGGAGGATARWRYSTGKARSHLRRHPDGYLVVRFEDLVREPEPVLRRVCSFLGEAYDPAMLTMAGMPERRERLAARAGRSGDEGILSTRFIGGYRGAVPASDLAFIQLHAGRRMRALGYELEPVRMTAKERARFAAAGWPSQVVRMVGWRVRQELSCRAPGRFGREPDPRTVVGEGAR